MIRTRDIRWLVCCHAHVCWTYCRGAHGTGSSAGSSASCHVEAAIALPSLASRNLDRITLTGVTRGGGPVLVYPSFGVPT